MPLFPVSLAPVVPVTRSSTPSFTSSTISSSTPPLSPALLVPAEEELSFEYLEVSPEAPVADAVFPAVVLLVLWG